MGILRNREELLPVTCAVLKENERESFFNDVRRAAKGNMDRVAGTVGVPVSTLQDWVNGASNIPYIALQRLASEFSVEMPTVTELRREYQQMVPNAAPRRPTTRMPSHPGPVGGAGRAPARREGPRVSGGNDYEPLRPAAPARQERPPRPERGGRRRREAKAQRPAKTVQKAPRPQQKPVAAAGPRAPKLSAQAAYWAGAALAAARRDGDDLVLTADRRIGQNFAVTWANLSQELFGVKPALAFSADELTQEARLPLAGLADFIGRLDLKPDAPRPPAPRWVWSNPDWKKAFLKGLADACADFRRDPALHLAPLGDHLRRSAEKLFASLALTPRANEDGSLTLAGQEAVEKYYLEVGSDNMKLRDQMKAFFGRFGAGEQAGTAAAAEGTPTAAAAGTPAAAAAPAGQKAPGRGRGRRRRGRRGGRSRAAAANSTPGTASAGTPVPEAPAPAEPAAELPPEV